MATINHKVKILNEEKNRYDTYHIETNVTQVYDFTKSKWLNEIISDIELELSNVTGGIDVSELNERLNLTMEDLESAESMINAIEVELAKKYVKPESGITLADLNQTIKDSIAKANRVPAIETELVKVRTDLETAISSHINDNTKHITNEERIKWNNSENKIATKTTLGNVKVGDGLGITSNGELSVSGQIAKLTLDNGTVMVANGNDLNDMIDGGFYYGYSLKNAPNLAGYIIVLKRSSTYVSQLFFDNNISTSNNMFRRNLNDGVWQDWVKVLDSDDILDDLTSTDISVALSANKGRELKELVDSKAEKTLSSNTNNGLMSNVDKIKLDGVATGANNYTHPNNHPASIILQDANNRFVSDTEKSTWNNKASTAIATTSINGLMSNADKVKLNGIANGATNTVVENILTSTSTSNALSAYQGKLLNDKIVNLETKAVKLDNIGQKSVATNNNGTAFGSNTTASGISSHAEGEYTKADGGALDNTNDIMFISPVTAGTVEILDGDTSIGASHAEGYHTLATKVSHVEGIGSKAIGVVSHAEGVKTTASGAYSHSEGNYTTASGESSHAEGNGSIASGNNSHAEGGGTIASGQGSHAEGESNEASGDYGSHAEGNYTIASGSSSHAEGRSTTASGLSSHAEGNATTASGVGSHAEGRGTTASKDGSHAEGQRTTASGLNSHAEGFTTTASGNSSHAEGDMSTASGSYSHAEGGRTTANGIYSHAEGQNTIAHSGTTSVSGNSTIAGVGNVYSIDLIDYTNKTIQLKTPYPSSINSNGLYLSGSDYLNSGSLAMVAYSSYDSATGTISYTGDLSQGSSTKYSNLLNVSGSGTTHASSSAKGVGTISSGNGSSSEGRLTVANGDYTHAEGYGTRANGEASHAEGYRTLANIAYSHAEGQDTKASGLASHAEGSSTTASGSYSHAEGYGTTAIANSSHAEGISTTASGNYSHAEGNNTIASGTGSHAEGYYTTASGNNSHAGGNSTIASGAHSFSHGEFVESKNYNSVAIGRYSNMTLSNATGHTTTMDAFVIGSGTSTSARSNAFRVTFDGKAYGKSAYNSTGADYAEYFEWLDKNIDNEDRVGYFVTTDGEKIRKSNSKDNYVLGIVSVNPALVGDSWQDEWNNKYLRDEWGRIQYHYVDVSAQFELIPTDKVGDEGNIIHEEVEISPARQDYVPILNPSWNPDEEYIPREKRKEWSPIGMMGKLLVRDDGTCEVNKFCKPNDDGIATLSDNDFGFRVMKRVSENIVQVLIK